MTHHFPRSHTSFNRYVAFFRSRAARLSIHVRLCSLSTNINAYHSLKNVLFRIHLFVYILQNGPWGVSYVSHILLKYLIITILTQHIVSLKNSPPVNVVMVGSSIHSSHNNTMHHYCLWYSWLIPHVYEYSPPRHHTVFYELTIRVCGRFWILVYKSQHSWWVTCQREHSETVSMLLFL